VRLRRSLGMTSARRAPLDVYIGVGVDRDSAELEVMTLAFPFRVGLLAAMAASRLGHASFFEPAPTRQDVRASCLSR